MILTFSADTHLRMFDFQLNEECVARKPPHMAVQGLLSPPGRPLPEAHFGANLCHADLKRN